MNAIPLSGVCRRAFGRLVLVLLAAPVLGGCASSYQFTVDAIAPTRDEPAAYSYRVMVSPAVAGEPDGSSLAGLVEADVRTALSGRGFFEAQAGARPELEIEVDYGISAPLRRVFTHTEPVYLSAGPGSGGPSAGREGAGRQALPRKVGERTVHTTTVVRRKFLRLTASAAGNPGGAERTGSALWSVLVTNEDESDDLGHYVRLMLAAGMDMIDRDTGEGRSVVLTDRDGRVTFIEAGMAEAGEKPAGRDNVAASPGCPGGAEPGLAPRQILSM